MTLYGKTNSSDGTARGEAPERVLRTMKRGAEVKKQGELRSAPSEQGDHVSEGHFESLLPRRNTEYPLGCSVFFNAVLLDSNDTVHVERFAVRQSETDIQ